MTVAAVVALVVVLVAALTGAVVTAQLRGALDTSLSREAVRVQRLVQTGTDTTGGGSDQCRYVVEPACTRLITADDPLGSGDGPLRVTTAAHEVATGTRPSVRTTADGVRVAVLPTGPGSAVMVGLPTRQTDTAVARTWTALALSGLVGTGLAAAAGYAVATLGLRPVRRLDDAVRRVRDTADPHARVALARNDELGRLADAFDEMLARLAAASDAQRDFAADASHELRTPLTTVRTNLQLLGGDRPIDEHTRAALRAGVEQELASMQATIDDLAELARGDRSPTALVATGVRDAASRPAEAAERRWGVPVRVTGPSGARAVVPDGRLPRLFDVLLDNAGKYGAGSPVDVVVAVDDGVVVTVTDRGPGIPPDERHRVFERFHRARATRSAPGSGLGLAIAAQIVAAAGGSIRAEDGPDGTGTTIRVHLPSA